MNSLRTKLTVFQGLAGFLGILLVILLAWFGSRQGALGNSIRNAENLSDQIAYSISIMAAQGGDTTFNYQRLIEKNATLKDVHTIKVLDKNGVILADNFQNNIGQTLFSPLINSARANLRTEESIEDNILIVVRPLHGETYTKNLNDVVGFIWVELDLAPAYQRAQQGILVILAVSLGGFLVIFFWYYQVTQKGILERLNVLSKGLLSVEKGHLTQRISVGELFGSTDEINELAVQFNQMIASLHRKLSNEELTTYLSTNFMNAPTDKMNEAILDALQHLGELFHVDRAFIFEFDASCDSMSNIHEWCAEGILPQKENLQDVPTSLLPWLKQQLFKERTIFIPSVLKMPPEAATEQSILLKEGIQSVLINPMMSDAGIFGFLGFITVTQERRWASDEVNLLNMLTGIITNTIIRHRSQRELEGQRDFALQIMNTVRQGLTVTNAQGHFMYVNPAYAQMLKRPAEELIGKVPIEFTLTNDQNTQMEEWQKRQKGLSSSYASRLSASDGSMVHVLISATPWMRDGQVIGSIASVTDLTKQMNAEEKLRQSEARNLAFLSAIPDLIFRIDKNGKFLDYKTGEGSALYISSEDIIGKTVLNTMPPDVGKMTMSAIKKSLETSLPQDFEYKLQTEDGLFTYEARVVASGTDEVIAIVHNITERARLEQMKTDFINRASHELRTPLTTALLMIDLLDSTLKIVGEDKNYWQILKQELNRERLILEDVLTVGRIESGKYRIADGLVNVTPILQTAINVMQPQADLRNIVIQFEVPETFPQIRGSEEAFARIFNNVISNAVKFSNPGGNVQVFTRCGQEGVLIEVQDQGIGIPPEDLPHITSRFFRGTNATEQEIPGSGIGLYMIKNIVEELGGKLTIHSQVGKGTILSMWFPIPKQNAE